MLSHLLTAALFTGTINGATPEDVNTSAYRIEIVSGELARELQNAVEGGRVLVTVDQSGRGLALVLDPFEKGVGDLIGDPGPARAYTGASVCASGSSTIWLHLTDGRWLNSGEICEYAFIEQEPPPDNPDLNSNGPYAIQVEKALSGAISRKLVQEFGVGYPKIFAFDPKGNTILLLINTSQAFLWNIACTKSQLIK